jgi:hypothetical protein
MSVVRFLLGYEGRVNFSIVTETPSLNMHKLLVSSKRGKGFRLILLKLELKC